MIEHRSNRRRKKKRRSKPWRSLHRMRSHQAAHDEAVRNPPGAVPEHPLIVADEPEIIESSDALSTLIEHVRDVGAFAYDTEFIGELSYYPRLCVVQVATKSRLALVDPLADLDLTGIWELIADASIETIVHAGELDLEPVHRHTGLTPASIFDTQIAAGFIALAYPIGLGRLIEELLGATVGKGLTFSNWDHRPLSDLHARYAADDVRYLPALRSKLLEMLEAAGLTAWATNECDAVAREAATVADPDALWRRVKGANGLRPRRLAVLRAMTRLREQAAHDQDVPPRSLVKDAVLLDLARAPAKSVADLARVPGLSKRVARAYGESIVRETQAALSLPKEDLPRVGQFVKLSPSDQSRVDALSGVASSLCHARAIAPGLAFNRRDLVQLHHALQGRRALEGCRLMIGWRRELLGEPLRAFVTDGRRLTIGWTDDRLTLEATEELASGNEDSGEVDLPDR